MRTAAVLLAAVTFAVSASAQTIFNATPDWISADTQVSTGAALVDLDRDGWLDLVVSNGNDMAKQHVAVYRNRGTSSNPPGQFPAQPDWQSADFVYNGHLDVADVNGDGWLDVAVATLGNGSQFGPAARVYLNNNGTLSANPDWSSAEIAPAFGLAFGDVNNDGRPDLAVGTGWAYGTPHQYYNYMYVNVNGAYATTASWQSADKWDYQGMLWVDANRDGWLDLVGVPSGTQTRLYRNLGGTLETTAFWQTSDSGAQDSIMAAAGDVTGEGWRELFIADNSQLGGSGKFRQYNGLAGGFFSQTANWTYSEGYCSAVGLADVNADGKLDLATGAWWDRTRVFLNNGSGFGASASWTSGGTSVVEKIAFGDIDRNAVHLRVEAFPGVPGQCLFYLEHQPIQGVVTVRRNGVPLPPTQYTFSGEHGWVTVGPGPGDVEIEYTYSTRLDMAVTNWDDTIGNYVYYNKLVIKGDANCDRYLNAFDIDPFVVGLTNPAAWQAQYTCGYLAALDMNGDGVVNAFDIDPFVAALTAP